MCREHQDLHPPQQLRQAGLRLGDEAGVAGADHLIHDDDIGFDRCGNGERQAQEHPGRVGAHGQLQKITQLGKLLDGGRKTIGFLKSEAHEDAAENDVLHAGGLEVHAQREVGERTQPPFHLDRAARRIIDAGEHAKKRRLAGAIGADDADAVAVAQSEVHALEGAHHHGFLVFRQLAAKRAENMELERARARIVHGKFHRNVREGNARHRWIITSRQAGGKISRRTAGRRQRSPARLRRPSATRPRAAGGRATDP